VVAAHAIDGNGQVHHEDGIMQVGLAAERMQLKNARQGVRGPGHSPLVFSTFLPR
jgi:hypothetical protein